MVHNKLISLTERAVLNLELESEKRKISMNKIINNMLENINPDAVPDKYNADNILRNILNLKLRVEGDIYTVKECMFEIFKYCDNVKRAQPMKYEDGMELVKKMYSKLGQNMIKPQCEKSWLRNGLHTKSMMIPVKSKKILDEGIIPKEYKNILIMDENIKTGEVKSTNFAGSTKRAISIDIAQMFHDEVTDHETL